MEGSETYIVKNLFAKAALDKAQSLKTKGIKIDVESFNNEGQLAEITIVGKVKKLFKISFEGNIAFLENPEEMKDGDRPSFPFEDMVTYLFVLANGGPVAGALNYPGTEKERFLTAVSKKIAALKKKGIDITFESFENDELVIIGKSAKKFKMYLEGEVAYLENVEYRGPGGRPVYSFEDMITCLFILANGGPVLGKLMYPGTEERKFIQVPVVAPT